MIPSVLFALIQLALNSSSCEFIINRTDSDVVLAIEEGRFAAFLNAVEADDAKDKLIAEQEIHNDESDFDDYLNYNKLIVEGWSKEKELGWTPTI